MLLSHILEAIGSTPVVELKALRKKYRLKGHIFVKREGCNLGGSSKSRVAFQILSHAIDEKKIRKGTTIMEERKRKKTHTRRFFKYAKTNAK